MSPTPTLLFDELPLSLAREVDAASARFESAWRAAVETGVRPRIEDYLAESPAPGRSVLVMELLRLEAHYRRRAGETPQSADYQERFPLLDDGCIAAALLPAGPKAPTPGTGHETPDVAGYIILGELGRGGMGVVYRARQVKLNRVVALKMILAGAHAGPRELQRFRREAEAVAQLQHPNIVQIHDVGEQAGRPYLALEFIGGGSLSQYLAGRPQPARTAAALLEVLARAVHYAHEHGILHRDLKPANVLLQIADCGLQIADLPVNQSATRNLQSAIPKLTDFGLAKLLGDVAAGPTASGDLLGTPSYMAPEQTAGKAEHIGPATDIYGLGAILYELLTGRPPFQAATALETVLQVRHDEPVPPSRLQSRCPRDLVTICLKCLHKEPARRYATAHALADDLVRFLEGKPIQARPVGSGERMMKWMRRRPAVAALLVGLVLVTAASFLVVVRQLRITQGALTGERQARQDLEARHYFNQIGRAHQAWQAYQVGQADRLLDECRSGVGAPAVPGWEWRYLKRLCRSELLRLDGHTQAVRRLTFSRDGRLLASCGGDWNGQHPGEVFVWDGSDGRLLHTFRGHPQTVYGVDFHPDGRRLASAGHDGTVRLWDLANPRAEPTCLPHANNAAIGVAYSPDGRRLAVACADGAVTIWEPEAAALLHTCRGHAGNVFSVAFSPDGKCLASGGKGQAVRLWDPATGQELRALTCAPDIRGVAFSPDSGLLAAAAYDGALKVWDLTKPEAAPIMHHLHAGAVHGVAFSPDGRQLAWCTNSGRVQLVDPRTGGGLWTVRGHDGAVLSLAFSPDGRRLATGGIDRCAKVWDVEAAQEMRRFQGHNANIHSFAFSSDGRRLALAGGLNRSSSSGRDFTVLLRDLADNRLVRKFAARSWLTCVAFRPDGTSLAAGSDNATVTVWDAQTAAVLHVLKGHAGPVAGVAYSPDGRQLASAGADATVRFWDADTGAEVRVLHGHDDAVTGVAYSPDGRLVASAGTDRTVRLWDAATGREVHTLRGPASAVTCVAFSPDGCRLADAAADQTVRLWDVATGQEVTPGNKPLRLGGLVDDPDHVLRQHLPPSVAKLTFSPDGRRLATVSVDRPLQLWDVATGLEALTLDVPEKHLLCVAFSPDGRRLVATSANRVIVWDAGPLGQ